MWLIFGQLGENFGFLFFQHLVTLPPPKGDRGNLKFFGTPNLLSMMQLVLDVVFISDGTVKLVRKIDPSFTIVYF